MRDLGLLSLRGVVGGLLIGHGSQKLFGSFDGPGPEKTAGMMDSLGLRPAKPWAMLAGASEFGGGLLMAAGFLNPLGPIGVAGAMTMAWTAAHRGKPIWSTSGGAELPLANIAAATALMLTGPGAYSLDRALGLSLPRWVAPAGIAAAAATVVIGTRRAIANQAQAQSAEAVTEQTQDTQPEQEDSVIEQRPAAPRPDDIRILDDSAPADVRAAAGESITTSP